MYFINAYSRAFLWQPSINYRGPTGNMWRYSLSGSAVTGQRRAAQTVAGNSSL